MRRARSLQVVSALAVVMAVVYLVLPEHDTAQEWDMRKSEFRQAALRAGPLIQAIAAFTAAAGHPPSALADVIPEYLDRLPGTGLRACSRFEYRSLLHKQGSIVWYDLGSRQGQPPAGQGRFSDGDPGHAILVLSLDGQDSVTSALLDRMPEDRDPLDFDPHRWKAGENRIEMVLALPDTYRLHGMPRDVFERLLGPPDGHRMVRGAPWELRINCPTGLLNHDTFVYWPTETYPAHLYGGTTEAVGSWVYVHS